MTETDWATLKILAIEIGIIVVITWFLGRSRQSREKGQSFGEHWKPPQQQKDEAANFRTPSERQNSQRAILNALSAQRDTADEKHRAEERRFWRRQIRVALGLNVISAVAAGVGLFGLGAVYIGITHADQGTINANRAWMSEFNDPQFRDPPQIGQGVNVEFAFGNSGRQPAINVTVAMIFDKIPPIHIGNFSNSETVRDNVCNSKIVRDAGAIFPNKSTFFYDSTIESDIKWDDVFNSDMAWIRVKGRIRYVTFGERHKTWFCHVFGPEWVGPRDIKKGVDCNGGNGAD